MAPENVSSSADLSIGFGDELYLHPNDVTSAPLICVKLTGTENYNIWSCAMKHVIGSKNKLGFLNDTCKRPANIDPLAKQWDMCNSVETYDKVDGSVTFNLHKSINSLSQNGFAEKGNNGDWTPSSVLAGKSPFYYVYGHEPSLFHIRVFGCLCFATTLNNSDKFSSRHPESPNDDGRVSSNDDGTESLTSQEEDGDSRATSMDENTPPEGITETFLDPNLDNSDQPAETVAPRRSSRPSRISAMNNEMEALNMNKTWIITDLSPNRKAIGWYSQREGIDYEETFSPVVKMVTIRCLIALAVKNKWDMYQLDVNNAFLCGNLETRAPRKWNEKLVLTLSEHGFIKRESDHSLFIKNTNDIFVVLLVYVDDIVITGNDSVEISKVKEFLSSKLQIKDLGKLKYFLGIEILEESNGVFISQRKYCLELLQEFGMLACKPIYTPMETNHVMAHLPTKKDPLLTNITGFQKLVGKLIYLTHTRPDISYIVQCLSQRMHAPLKSNMRDALKVLRYLKGSLGKGLRYYSDIQSDPLSGKVVGFTDADWAK
ncbi:ribonuclease H-like domain-containing protein [Tanacetum coccineum]|uniref:Ribonuclease H-like domain-containing protein n=1 Tax=Tanacetum coccineum TaxID=301880 RepID=A0ABQ5GN25_9ASTR